MSILRAIWVWLRSSFRWAIPVRPLTTILAEELPENLDPAVVYVLGEGSNRWFVAMNCPCGCKAICQMSLLEDAKPKWVLTEHDDGTISLHPSVWRTEGCCSHFVLHRGLIHWCPVAGASRNA